MQDNANLTNYMNGVWGVEEYFKVGWENSARDEICPNFPPRFKTKLKLISIVFGNGCLQSGNILNIYFAVTINVGMVHLQRIKLCIARKVLLEQ